MEGTGMLNGGITPQQGRKLWQYLASLSACLLALGAGTALAWTSPVLPKLQEPQAWLHVSEEQGSWVGSLMAVGAIVGALPSGALANILGRKKSILLLAGPFLASWVGIIFARYVWMLYIARIVAGIGVGATCVLVPMYIAEIAETSARGALGAMFQLMLTIGILFGFVAGAGLSYTWFGIICALVEVLFIGTFIWMPESPQWLVGKGRKSDASRALAILRGDSYDLTEELAKMQKEAEEQEARNSSIFSLVNTRGARTALFASMGLMAFQQLSGVNAVIFYTVTIFKAAGSSLDPDVAAVIVALVQVVMSGVAALVVDKAGRKPLLAVSSSMMCVCLVALGLYFKLQSNKTDVSNLGWLPLVSLTVFMIVFSLGFGPIPWMMMGELFPAETKGLASGLAVMTNWLLVFFVTKTFPAMNETFGQAGAFWIFAVIMAIATVFTFFVVPETKGKSLQEIQDELNGVNRNVTV